MAHEHTIPETGVVFVGLARERLEATNEPLNQLESVARIFECSLLGDPQAAIIRRSTNRVRSLINRALQVLSAPRDGTQEQPEDTTEDLHTALARTSAWVDFAGHPLQDMWATLQRVSRRTEQSQFELLQTVEGLRTLDHRLGRARMSAGGEHTVYIQPDRNIIPDGPYVLGEYEAIRLRNPPPDEELASGVAPRMMALRPVKDEATDRAFRYAMRMNAVTGPPGPRPVVPFHLRTCFVVRAKVNGCEVLTMVDTGSMTNFVSPAFATVAKLATFTLESQLPLQLGCVGSRSTITHGVHVPVCLGHVTRDTYFDVANIDRYDCIIGLLFLRLHRVCLDFGEDTLRIEGHSIANSVETEMSVTPNARRRIGRPPAAH